MKRPLVICSTLMLLSVLFSVRLWAMEESISGVSYRVIQAAMSEFVRKNLDITRYRITVAGEGSSYLVTFIDASAPNDPSGHMRGNPGKIPAFSVELSRDDLRLIRSNFVR
jgi:hypothetical protein